MAERTGDLWCLGRKLGWVQEGGQKWGRNEVGREHSPRYALGWLVLKLTGSGTWLGSVIAAQFLPMLLLGPFGGVIADRVDKRRFLFVTQSLSGVLAVMLGAVVVTGSVQLWMVFVLAVVAGTVNALDMPTRQTFVYEMVGPDLLANAVTLNSVVMNGARIVGPAVAGVLIATVGLAPCFFVNGVSFAACIVALAGVHPTSLIAVEPHPRQKGQLREGFRSVWSNPALRTPLLLMAVIGTLTYEFQISMPLIARSTFGAGAGGLRADDVGHGGRCRGRQPTGPVRPVAGSGRPALPSGCWCSSPAACPRSAPWS